MSNLYVQEDSQEHVLRLLKRKPYNDPCITELYVEDSEFLEELLALGWTVDEWIETYLKYNGDFNHPKDGANNPDADDFFIQIDKSRYGYDTLGMRGCDDD